MSDYAKIIIGKYSFFEARNEIKSLLYIFSKNDFYKNQVVVDGEEYVEYKYVTTIKKAKEILDATGHTLKNMKNIFLYTKEDFYYNENTSEEENKKYNFEDWQNGIIRISRLVAEKGFDYKKKIVPNNYTEKIILDSLDYNWKGLFWGIPYENLELRDKWSIFRTILEAFEDNEQIVLDYSSLVYGGYCEEDVPEEWFEIERNIIMMEGKFDVFALSNVIDILYPHLKKCYYFMDFEISRLQR